MKRVITSINTANNIIGGIAGLFMIASVSIVVIEIIARFFNSTIYITTEFTGYFLVSITFLGLGYTLKEKGHIRLGFINQLVKKRLALFIIELYALIVGFIAFVVITYVSTQFVWESASTGLKSIQITETYLAIPQAAIPIGSLFISLQFISEILNLIIKYRNNEEITESESQSLGH